MSRAREADECFKCRRPVPWDRQVNVPTAKGADRVCCLPCSLGLGGTLVGRMSRTDRERMFAFGCDKLLPKGNVLGLTRRTFSRGKGG